MAFDQENFGPIGGETMKTPTVYGYRTSDSLTDVQAAGYFNEKVFQIEDGDYFFITAASSVGFGYYSNDGTNVSVNIIEGSEGVENPWPSFTAVSTDTTITQTVQCLAVDASAGAVTITLPTLGLGNYIIKKIDSSANAVIIDADGSTIDGDSTKSIVDQYVSVTVNNTPSEWAIQ